MFEPNLLSKKKQEDAVGVTKFLMHFNGTNNSTAFVDECGNVITRDGTPVISTTRSKFGNGSGSFSDQVLNIQSPIILSEDYTIEGWFYRTSLQGSYLPLISGNDGSYNFPLIIDYDSGYSQNSIGMYLQNGIAFGGAPGGFQLNRWHHVASTRKGGTYRLFVDGGLKYSKDDSIIDVIIDRIGGWSASGFRLFGYLDEVRVVDKAALYTTSFTVPTMPFTI